MENAYDNKIFEVEGRQFFVVRNVSRWSVYEKGAAGKTVVGPLRQKVMAAFNDYRAKKWRG